MTDDIDQIESDILVIGGGLAGCFAAIKAREAGAEKVVQVDKGYVGRSGCSAFAAGVMAVFLAEEDDWEEAFKEGVAGTGTSFLCDQERLEDHFKDIGQRIKDMETFGVEFERTADGKIERMMGRGGHKTMMFHGPQLMEATAKATHKTGVKWVNRTTVTDLLLEDGRVIGALGFHVETGKFTLFTAKATVIAARRLWGFKGLQPGHRNVTGDLLAAAYRVGATLMNTDDSFCNSFPARYDVGPGMNMYVSHGGIFRNAAGERFLPKYDNKLKERALFEIIAHSMALETKQGKAPFFMDMTHLEPETVRKLKRVLPLPMKMYEKVGLLKGDKFLKSIEWIVTTPYLRSGIKVNRAFETELPGLFACGDAAPPAGHSGGQRAMPGAATSGARSGTSAARFADNLARPKPNLPQAEDLKASASKPLERSSGVEPDQVVLAVQEAITPYEVLLLRREDRLAKALSQIEDIRDNLVPYLKAYDSHYLRMALEAQNMVFHAEIVLRSALARKESRISIREDYPYTDNSQWLKWIVARRNGSSIAIDTEPAHRRRGFGRALVAETATRLLAEGFTRFRTVVVTVRFADFDTRSRSHTLPAPAASARTLRFEAMKLLMPFLDHRENPQRKLIRLIGVRVEKLGK